VNSTTQCERCNLTFHNCSTCTLARCLTCQEGYQLDSATHTCYVLLPCTPPCLVCRTNTATSCLACVPGYFLDSTPSCTPCADNCLACSSLLLCTRCASPYFNDNGACKPCPVGKFFSKFG
jgi:hypothetical protein